MVVELVGSEQERDGPRIEENERVVVGYRRIGGGSIDRLIQSSVNKAVADDDLKAKQKTKSV